MSHYIYIHWIIERLFWKLSPSAICFLGGSFSHSSSQWLIQKQLWETNCIRRQFSKLLREWSMYLYVMCYMYIYHYCAKVTSIPWGWIYLSLLQYLLLSWELLWYVIILLYHLYLRTLRHDLITCSRTWGNLMYYKQKCETA